VVVRGDPVTAIFQQWSYRVSFEAAGHVELDRSPGVAFTSEFEAAPFQPVHDLATDAASAEVGMHSHRPTMSVLARR
jgi:hypothetical protein